MWSGGGQSGQTCPNFIRGDPVAVGSIKKEKILTKIGGKLDMLQATFWLFLDALASLAFKFSLSE